MHGLQLHPHVSFGVVSSRPIFLDLDRDRYIALDARSERDFLAASAGEPISAAGRERLLATGLFRTADAPSPLSPVAVPLPEASLLDQPRASASLSLALRAYRITARTRRRLGREPILSVLQDRPTHLDGSAAVKQDMMLSASRRFLAARSLIPIPPKCLPDSLALREWLGRAGLRPILVFAVKLDPFGAHCWLQSDKLILNDAVDAVSAFTPVLVLR
jgi:hypothetical protein